MARLELVPIYLPDHARLLDGLAPALEQALQASTRRRTVWFDPEAAFDVSRGQYSSTRLLGLLLDDPARRADWVLGVTGVDLFVPVLTYVFGEAQLSGRAAIVSIQRLRAEAYGLPPDEHLLARRLLKESLHELGHVLGLLHCLAPDCVMHASTYVEDVDLKPAAYCASCLQGVRRDVDSARRA